MDKILTPEQIQALADADDAIKAMNQSWDDMARALTVGVAPAITAVTNRLTELLNQEDKLKSFGETWLKIAARGPTGLLRGAVGAVIGPEAPPTTSTGIGLPPGGRSRTPFVPDFEEAAKEQKKLTDDAMRGLEELAVTTQRITVSATEQLYRDMDAATQTAQEKALVAWTEFDSQVEELLAAGRITQEDAAARIAENASQYLEEVQITAHKVFPPEEQQKLDVFWEEASRNTQDIIADTLVNGFDEGIDGMLRSFAQMLVQMAAQALAADIAGKIFGSGGSSSGGGWMDALMSFFGGFFESGGFIAPGQFGVVGESGPEIVMGGNVGKTIIPMAQAAPAPQVNLRNINAFDTGVIRDYLLSAQGEEVMLNFISRNGTRVRMASVGG
jgi:hypothetical protein